MQSAVSPETARDCGIGLRSVRQEVAVKLGDIFFIRERRRADPPTAPLTAPPLDSTTPASEHLGWVTPYLFFLLPW